MKSFPPPTHGIANPTDALGRYLHQFTTTLAMASFVLVLTLLVTDRQLPGKPGWPEALLVFTATLATLTALARQLPMQNILLGALLIGGIGTVIHGFGVFTAIPFGPLRFTEETGPRIFEKVAWAVPLLWVLAVLNSRGVARLILRPWRKLRAYGFWLIGLTIGLTVLWEGALEPFAVVVKHYWHWQPTRLPITWGSAPLTNFLGWFVATLLIMAFVTPVLIDKRARPASRPPDYHPMVIWLLGLVLFGTGAALRHLWLPAGYCVGLGAGVAVFAIRGARW